MEGRFLPDILAAFTAENALYALPLTYKNVALFYNEKLVSKPPKTTDEMIQLGRRLTNRAAGRYGLVYQATEVYFHAPWLYGFGGRLLTGGACARKLAIQSPEALKAMNFARELAGPKGIVPPEVTGQLVATLFKNGKAAMAISGPWFLSQIGPSKPGGLQYKVALLPEVSATRRPATPLLSAEGIFMSSACRHKRAAFKVMRYLTSDASSAFRLRESRQLPANRSVDRRLSQTDPLLAAFRDQRKRSRLTPATPMMRMLWQPYNKALSAVIARGEEPRKALKEAEWEVGKTLGACLAARTCGSGAKGKEESGSKPANSTPARETSSGREEVAP